MKVLVVDDDPFIVDMYTAAIKEAGFEVECVSDGRQGLDKIASGGYDVALVDIVLPSKDGFEILETLRRRGGTHPKVILLTNLGRREDIERGLALGAADYIIKAHFTPQEVVEKVKHALGQKP